ncbi:conjugal transfer protein TraD [Komagataeibacter xylinus]|uniref:conjugal transfer protein TraD n=1 Tax=Komagataeibacter xylinus TaxID=28448 RepID=UPI0038D0F260
MLISPPYNLTPSLGTPTRQAVKAQKTLQLGELVEATGADTLSIEALAGVLLAAVEQADGKPEAVARWTERGTAFFQAGAKKGGRKGT